MSRPRRPLRLALALAAALPACGPAPIQTGPFTEPEACMPVVRQRLDQLGIADVRRIFIERRLSMGNTLGGDSRLMGYDAWVKLERCEGSLVVDMTTECWVRQVYTRGDCTIEGVPGY